MQGLSVFIFRAKHPAAERSDFTMNLRIELKHGTMTAALRGDIDHHAAAGLRAEIDAAAKQVRPHTLRLDFSEVAFMDSSGIGLILGRVRLLSLWEGKVVLTGLSDPLRRMAELSGVAGLARIEEKRKEAKA